MSLDFLLVHGGWQDGSCWDGTAAYLTADGHRVHAPTMAGHGDDGGNAVTIADCVASVSDYIHANQLEDFVLVGHSISGIVIAKLAEQMPDRVRRLVFQNAYVLRDGESVYDLLPAAIQRMLAELAQQSPTAKVALDFETFHQMFINDAGLETARAAFSKLCAGTINRQLERVQLKTFFDLPIPASYLHCMDDLTMVEADWSWHPDMSGRLRNPRIVEIPGSHEVCFSNPEVLARGLVEAARP